MAYKILAINPGSTSTKISLANDDQPVFVADIAHSRKELSKFKRISDQYHFRKQVVIEELKNRNIPLDFDAVIGRGGLAKPVSSGVFTITEQMIIDQQRAIHQHACDLGCMIADEIAREIPGCKSFYCRPRCGRRNGTRSAFVRFSSYATYVYLARPEPKSYW